MANRHKIAEPVYQKIAVDIAEKIKSELPKGVELAYLKLHETENSYGEWFAEDN